jgi:hypothetical protein
MMPVKAGRFAEIHIYISYVLPSYVIALSYLNLPASEDGFCVSSMCIAEARYERQISWSLCVYAD